MAEQAMTLNGRVAAVTGGARGIGRATAAALLAAGVRVGLGDIDVELARHTADELGADVRAYELDVTSRASVRAFLDAVESDLGPLDVLVNNAGIMPVGPFLDEGDASAARQVDINLHGVIFGMKEALPRMIARGRGHVVNLASAAGKSGIPYLATYCATKHAVVGITEAVRAELSETGIAFTSVLPALVNTELTAGLQPGRLLRKAEPEEVGEAIVAALREPRPEVYVPRSLGAVSKISDILPRRASEAFARMLDADKVIVRADMTSRAGYEQRIAPGDAANLDTRVPDQPAA